MRRAFTLIELLVCVAIIALLMAILLPTLNRARGEGRRTVCLANLKQLGIAGTMYLDANRESFWRYYQDQPAGRQWWFGFEPGGPPSNTMAATHRPLDKARGVLARDLKSTDDGLQCPSFPYDSGQFWPKFARRSASYGFNLLLGPPNQRLNTRRRSEFARRSASVFVFADAVHYDFESDRRFNEGFFVEYVPKAATPWGYGHFRHHGEAQLVLMDGHAEGQRLRGPSFQGAPCDGPAGNLTDPGGGSTIYGF